MQVAVGQIIDSKYRIVRMLGEGGMGAVYEGQNVRIGHRVAIKVLHAEVATRHDIIERFEREAQAAGQIGSNHIVQVYDLGDLPEGARYMVMEYLDGENLAARVQREGRISTSVMAPILLQVLEGLGAAHAAGIVHRDLKPENIFLVRDKKTGGDFVKLVDFGVSKFSRGLPSSEMSMTRTGSVIGTPFYMSPEQAKGSKLTDHRSDLYSIGVVLFECTTGQVPFLADTFNELMFKIVLDPMPDPAAIVPGFDAGFASIMKMAMAREPDGRYQSAAAFQHDVSEWMRSMGVQGGTFNVTPVPRIPMTSGGAEQLVAPGPLGETAVPLSSTAGSQPGVAATGVPAASSKKGAALFAAIAVAMAVAAGAVLVSKKKIAPAPPPVAAAMTAQAVEPLVPSSAPAVPVEPPPSAAPSVAMAPPSAAASAAAPEAGAVVATNRAHAAGQGAKPKAPATYAPAPPANATAEQVKGRTIRTDL